MLWLCLHFPKLPLELFAPCANSAIPSAVTDGKGARRRILLCNDAAAACGIRAGMSPSAAGGLAAALRVHARDAAAEREALAGLAAWAGQYTSLVSLAPPQSLLLEIAGSLHLFKGLAALRERVLREIDRFGYHTDAGLAPTPAAAALLARARLAAPVLDLQELPAALRRLPLQLLDLDERLLEALHGLGLRSFGELLRLPRADLARRLGPALIDQLDRILGRQPDPRVPYTPPTRFARRLPLPAATDDVEALAFPAQRLLLELAGFLRARQAATQALHWTFAHHRRPPTRLALGLAALQRDPQHLLALLRERLARLALAQPVEALGLEVHDIRPLQPRALTLDGEDGPSAEDWPLLVERLRARLGDDAVQGLQCAPEHRPERASRAAAPGATGPLLPPSTRPLWLLPAPIALAMQDARPCLDAPLRLLAGPERIESGWWDDGDLARDYFVATDAAHACYWIFRERRGERRWYLHGYFA